MSPPPAGSRSVSATSGRLDSLPWSNADRLHDASPTLSQQLPEPPCIRPRCPYDLFPWDEERVASWAPWPTSAAFWSLSFAQACERWCDLNHTPQSRNRHLTSPGHATSPRVRTHLLAVGEHQMCGRLWLQEIKYSNNYLYWSTNYKFMLTTQVNCACDHYSHCQTDNSA